MLTEVVPAGRALVTSAGDHERIEFEEPLPKTEVEIYRPHCVFKSAFSPQKKFFKPVVRLVTFDFLLEEELSALM